MFETLKSQLNARMAETSYELAHCHDMYRLLRIAEVLKVQVDTIRADAHHCVCELEGRDS